MMAVLVPAGDSEIVFSYSADGQTKGIALTIFGFVALAGYLVYRRFFDKDDKVEKKTAEAKAD